MKRRFPRWSELRELLQIRRPMLSLAARVEAAPSVGDLRRLAQRRAPQAVFDYVDGGAEEERTMQRSRDAFARVEFLPRVMRDVSNVDPGTTILGRPVSMPAIFAPTGFTRMMHTSGEPAVAKVAAMAGLPYVLSTLGTTSIEDLAASADGGDNWYQLYMPPDRGLSKEMLQRARNSGYRAIMLTVDTSVGGMRLRDLRNGLTVPPKLTWKTLLDGAMHPAWWLDLLTTPTLQFANFADTDIPVGDLLSRLVDPAITPSDVAWLKAEWDGPVIVKGVQVVEDAVAAVEAGADAVVLSTHGGRQLDRAPVPMEILPEVAKAIAGRAEVYLDGGVMSGADIAAAVARGANAVMFGRAYLYGLMAGGANGVQRVHDLLSADYTRTLHLLGVSSTEELNPELVRLRP